MMPPDYVYKNAEDGFWYFHDEILEERRGPFFQEEEARAALAGYKELFKEERAEAMGEWLNPNPAPVAQ